MTNDKQAQGGYVPAHITYNPRNDKETITTLPPGAKLMNTATSPTPTITLEQINTLLDDYTLQLRTLIAENGLYEIEDMQDLQDKTAELIYNKAKGL